MKDFTDITFIVDRSGSMYSLIKDVVGGYAQFVQEQKDGGDNASMTLVRFDDQYEIVFNGVPIKHVSRDLEFEPRGSTALLDAIGKTINTVGQRLARTREADRPDKVVFVIFTDGHENASEEFSYEQIKKMVEHQQGTYNWKFLFLGANIDSFGTGARLGINAAGITNYAYSAKGMSAGMRSASTYTSTLRKRGVVDVSMNNLYHQAEAEEDAKVSSGQ